MQKAYSVLAGYYDSLMTDFNYTEYYDYVRRYAKGRVLELASGSGVFTALLLSSAEEVLAVDISREMLDIAKERNFRNRKYVKFVESSMLDFELMHKMDNAFCVCDGVNYISQAEVAILAAKVSDSIKVGGHFIFDISSSYKLTTVIANNIFYEDTDDFTYLWTNKLSDKSVQMDIAVFEKEKDSNDCHNDTYKRRDEQHSQYIHEQKNVVDAMTAVGFDVKVVSGEDFGEVKPDSKRLLFICHKIK